MPTEKELIEEVTKMCPIIKNNAVRINPQALGEIVGYEIGVRFFNRAIQSGIKSNEMVSKRHRYGVLFERELANIGRHCDVDKPNECLHIMRQRATHVALDIPIPKKDVDEIIDDMLCVGGLDLILMNK